jgi:hypothetical protein
VFPTNCLNNAWTQYENSAGFGLSASPISDPCTVTDWTVNVVTAPGVGQSLTFTIRKNGAATSAQVVISGTNTSGTWQGSVCFAAGDLISVQVVTTAGITNSTNVYWTIWYNTPGNYYLILAGDNAAPSGAGTYYYPAQGGNNIAPTTATGLQQVIPTSLTVTKIAGCADQASGAAQSYTFAAYKVSTSTASSFTAVLSSSAAGAVAVSSVGSMAFSPGDTIAVQLVMSAGAGWSRVSTCLTVSPAVAGEVVQMYGSTAAPSTTATNYESPQGMGNNGWNATESTVRMQFQPSVTFRKLYAAVATAPANTKSWAFTLRVAAANTALTCTISNTATTANDTAHAVTESAADYVDVSVTPSGTPTSTSGVRFSFVEVIPQPKNLNINQAVQAALR